MWMELLFWGRHNSYPNSSYFMRKFAKNVSVLKQPSHQHWPTVLVKLGSEKPNTFVAA